MKRYHSTSCDLFYEFAHPDFTFIFVAARTLHMGLHHKGLLYAKSFKIILRTLKFPKSHVCALMIATHALKYINFAYY